MTVMIHRKALILLVLPAIGATIVVAATGFTMLRDAVELSPLEAKVLAERLLFVGVVAASALFVTLTAIMARAYQLNTTLSRIAEMHRVGGYDVGPALHRLGDVGESITRMYGQLTELSTRKTTRIAAMNSLLNVIMARSSQRLLVVDPRGEVFRATPGALKFLDTTAGAVLGKPVNTVIPDVEFSRARAATGDSGEPWAAEDSSFPVAVQPVLNDRGETGYFVYYLGPDARLIVQTDPGRDQPDAISPDEPPLPPPPRPVRKKDSFLSRLRRIMGGPPS